ncbi:MAG: thioredoxin domain-containing protein [Psychroflexus sp.]
MLGNIAKVYQKQYDQLLETAEKLTQGIQTLDEITPQNATSQVLSKTEYKNLFENWQKYIDQDHGGFKGAPKFPMANTWLFPLQYYVSTGKTEALEAVWKTLNQMSFGGIYDQIGGGFSRYAVDGVWFAPHFEKMLYDNALLIELYAEAYRIQPENYFKNIIIESIEFVKRELMDENHAFLASLDADSEGEEGKFYTWTYDELVQVLNSEDLTLVEKFYNVKAKGNWEHGRNILFTKMRPQEFASIESLSHSEFDTKLDAIKSKLFQIRSKRERPALDDKVLTAWNAMMLKALIQTYKALGRPQELQLAEQNAKFLLNTMKTKTGRLFRNYKNGATSIPGFLDDYAFLIEALIDLYQVTFEKNYLEEAKNLVEICFKDFQDEHSGLFFYTSNKGEQLIAKKTEINDNVIPASNAVLAKCLFLLGRYFDDEKYTQTSENMLNQVKPKFHKSGPYHAAWQVLAGWMTHPFYEIAIMGEEAQDFALEMQGHYKANAIYLGGTSENLELLKGKIPSESAESRTLIYVCVNKTCQQPMTNTKDALALLEKSS